MKKSILALVLAAVLITALVFVAAPKAEAAVAHEDGKAAHCVCNNKAVGKENHKTCSKDIKWQAINSWADLKLAINALRSGDVGNYYLTTDLTATTAGAKLCPGATANICFNGHTITVVRMILTVGGTMNFTDCTGNGGMKAEGDFTAAGSRMIYQYGNSTVNIFAGNFTAGCKQGIFYVNAAASSSAFVSGDDTTKPVSGPAYLNIFGGKLTRTAAAKPADPSKDADNMVFLAGIGGATLNMYGGEISSKSSLVNDYALIYSVSSDSVINIKGGTISGGTVNADSASPNGGNICSSGTVNISGGTIKNGTAENYGGNIFMTAYKYEENQTPAVLNISGGTVSGGKVTNVAGGNIALQNANATISGGTIKDGESTGTAFSYCGGGNITLAAGTLDITGGTISGGIATQSGGNLLIRQADDSKNMPAIVNISGGTFRNGSAGTAEVTGNGGDIFVVPGTTAKKTLPHTLNITGGNFSGGTATRYGGSICVNGAMVNDIVVKNAKFSDGVITNSFGGNVYFNSSKNKVLIENCTITGGSALEAGGNVYNNGAVEFVIKDCTIKDGSAKIGGGISCKPGMLVTLQGTITTAGNVNGDMGIRGAGTTSYSQLSAAGLTGGKASVYAPVATEFGVDTSDKIVACRDTQEIKTEGGKMFLQGKGGNVVSVNGTGYATMAEAVAAMADGDLIRLLIGTAGQKLELTKNAIIDLNGCAIDEITVAAGKTLYGYDSATNAYNEAAAANVKITGEGTVAATYATTEPIRKYITIKTGDTYSFHRYYVGITKKTLHVGTKGIGVTAVFAGTPSVKALLKDAKTFGVELNSAADFTGTANNVASSTAFVSGKVNTLQAIVDNYLLTKDAAEAKLYARAYLELADGTKLYSAVATVDAKEVMQAIDASAAALDEDKKKAVQLMINGLSWNMPKEWAFTGFEKK